MKALARLQHWWKNGLTDAHRQVPYQIVCACGQPAHGLRKAKHQIILCITCNRKLFVLPFSPLPPVKRPSQDTLASKTELVRWRSRPWFGPLVAGGLTLLASVIIFALVLNRITADRQQG